MAAIDLDRALRDPAGVFAAPGDVLAAPFPEADKIRILEQWKVDAIELSRSAGEGMEGPVSGETLRQIQDALNRLKS